MSNFQIGLVKIFKNTVETCSYMWVVLPETEQLVDIQTTITIFKKKQLISIINGHFAKI